MPHDGSTAGAASPAWFTGDMDGDEQQRGCRTTDALCHLDRALPVRALHMHTCAALLLVVRSGRRVSGAAASIAGTVGGNSARQAKFCIVATRLSAADFCLAASPS